MPSVRGLSQGIAISKQSTQRLAEPAEERLVRRLRWIGQRPAPDLISQSEDSAPVRTELNRQKGFQALSPGSRNPKSPSRSSPMREPVLMAKPSADIPIHRISPYCRIPVHQLQAAPD